MHMQIVYILDQVRALENEMLHRIQRQGLDIAPRILIVSVFILIVGILMVDFLCAQVHASFTGR